MNDSLSKSNASSPASTHPKPRKLHPKFRPYHFDSFHEMLPLPINSLSIGNRSNSISSSISDESSTDLLTTPCLSPSVLVTDEQKTKLEQKIIEKNDDSFHVLYVHLNGEYVPIAKTSFIIQTSLPTLNPPESSLKQVTAPVRSKNYRCDYPGCTKA